MCFTAIKRALALLVLIAVSTAYAGVSFIPPLNAATQKKFELPSDLAARLAADIAAAPFEYLDEPHLPAIAEYQISFDGTVYWCHLRDALFVESDRPGHAKIKRVPVVGYLSKQLDGGSGKRVYMKDADLQKSVIKGLREFYAQEDAKKK